VDGAFLERSDRGGLEFERLYVQAPLPVEVIAERPISAKQYEAIRGEPNLQQGVHANELVLLPGWTKPLSPRYVGSMHEAFYEIVLIGGRHYVLTANAFYFSVRDVSATLLVSLVEYRKPGDFEIKCHFKAKRAIVAK
jgi:hypothetical protein